ncbi:two-component response regulator-like APRR1 [Benincasa hispida]|uniref:two-component response regulator-like APRR1 n=1 Tax=Benincasa hispida TaxID=102211 RepID=UPI00190004C2|nr:two-component response regulator-like APRR1 [Benincasa hispida]
MASIPQFYCDQYSSVVAAPPSTAASVGTGGGPFWGEDQTNLVPLLDDFGLLHDQPTQYSSNSDKIIIPALPIDPATTSFSQQDMLAFPQLNIIPSSMCGIHDHNAAAPAEGSQNFCHLGCQPDHQFYEFSDDCFGLVPEIKPLYHPLPPHNWENQSNQVPVAEDSNMKVGRYSEEVRKERILRYLKKRNQRNFNKTIKYACRKTLADRRIRVRGRFARNNEASDQEINPTTKNDTSIHKDTELLYNNHDFGVQMKRDEEEWLQEITSLMCLPYISS